MSLVLDAGALVAFDKGDRPVRALLERASRSGVHVRTTTGAVAKAWRDGARQARLALLLRGVFVCGLRGGGADLRPVAERRSAARSVGSTDVIDGSIVDAATDGDEILTSDPDDIEALALSSGKTLLITTV